MAPLEKAQHIAYLKSGMSPLGYERSIVFEDDVVRNTLKDMGVLPVDEGFGIVHATKETVDIALKKSDVEETYEVSEEIEGEALRIIGDMFKHYDGRFYTTSLENCRMDGTKSAGYPFKDCKREAVQKHFPYLCWYVKPGNLDRDDPIFTDSPKVEYLCIEDIRNGKIRIFRNPPVDYLCLEKVCFQEMEDHLSNYDRSTWVALGFVKEFGNWDRFVRSLMYNNHTKHRRRYYYRWDIQHWDKRFGPRLGGVCMRVRIPWFKRMTPELLSDIKFLYEQAGVSLEILPNGELIVTSIAQKSGRLLTASDNTLGHIFIFIVHYIRMCEKFEVKPSCAHMMQIYENYIYSDDIQGATDYPEWVELKDLQETFSLFGMGVKEYVCSEDPESIHFLGADNRRYGEIWVPVYDEKRMFYALCNVGGRMSDVERTQRISGLAHNLAFSEKYASVICELSRRLHNDGRWIDSPLLDEGLLKKAYTPVGIAQHKGSLCLRNGGAIRPESRYPIQLTKRSNHAQISQKSAPNKSVPLQEGQITQTKTESSTLLSHTLFTHCPIVPTKTSCRLPVTILSNKLPNKSCCVKNISRSVDPGTQRSKPSGVRSILNNSQKELTCLVKVNLKPNSFVPKMSAKPQRKQKPRSGGKYPTQSLGKHIQPAVKELSKEIKLMRKEGARREAQTYQRGISLSNQKKWAPGIPRTKRSNPYLQTLIYPDRFRGVRYPDAYGRKTAMNCLVLEVEIPYFNTTAMVTENPGDYYCVWRASLVHPFWVYGLLAYATTGVPYWSLGDSNERFGITATGAGAITAPEQDSQMGLASGQTYNLKMPLLYSKVDYVNDPYYVINPDGSAAWGYVLVGDGAAGTTKIQIAVSIAGQNAIGDTIIVTIGNSTGTTPITTTIASTITNQSLFFATSADISSLMLTETSAAYGAANIKAFTRKQLLWFRIQYNTAGGFSGTLIAANFGVTLQTAFATNQLLMYPMDFPDVSQLLQKVTRYRPVSSSAWLAYEGSTLNDGGSCSSLMYRGGNHPNQSGLYTFQGVSQTPDSYEDKVKKGTYGYILPATTDDTGMRLPVNIQEWTHPYIVIVGNMGTFTQTSAIRMRAVMNMEFISSSQLWDYEPSGFSPAMIAEAIRILHGAPCVMENDTHLKTIYTWLKNAATDVGEWGVRNSGWLVPLGRAAATALLAL